MVVRNDANVVECSTPVSLTEAPEVCQAKVGDGSVLDAERFPAE